MKTKICKLCKEDKNEEEYYIHRNKERGKEYRGSYCKVCQTMNYNKCDRDEAITRLEKIKERNDLKTIDKQRCSICKEIKSNDNFFNCKDRLGKYRLRGFCKICDHNYRQQNRMKLRQANRYNDLCAKIKTKCNRKNIAFNLTTDFLNDLFVKQNGRCALTGVPFPSADQTALSPHTLSIDRIIPSYGYTVGNVRLVTYIVNCALNKWGEESLYEMCKSYISNRENRNG
jgi:hypothetical protein